MRVQYAHLLLLVVDISDPSWQMHIATVHQVLDELEVKNPILYLFNKIDKIDEAQLATLPLARYEPHLLTSTRIKHGLDPLIAYLRTHIV